MNNEKKEQILRQLRLIGNELITITGRLQYVIEAMMNESAVTLPPPPRRTTPTIPETPAAKKENSNGPNLHPTVIGMPVVTDDEINRACIKKNDTSVR